jgi:CheY-like chemotaxis protein
LCNVFVVDDDDGVRETISVFLSMLGHEVHAVSDGREALGWLSRHVDQRPCVAVVDLRMPALDGWDLLEAMRRDPAWKDLPVVVLSATITDDAPPPVLDADDFWSKPLDFDRFERIHEYCRKHSDSWPSQSRDGEGQT